MNNSSSELGDFERHVGDQSTLQKHFFLHVEVPVILFMKHITGIHIRMITEMLRFS